MGRYNKPSRQKGRPCDASGVGVKRSARMGRRASAGDTGAAMRADAGLPPALPAIEVSAHEEYPCSPGLDHQGCDVAVNRRVRIYGFAIT